MKNINVIELKVEARDSVECKICLKEAVVLAVKEWRNVRVYYDEDNYLIRPDLFMKTIERNGEAGDM